MSMSMSMSTKYECECKCKCECGCECGCEYTMGRSLDWTGVRVRTAHRGELAPPGD